MNKKIIHWEKIKAEYVQGAFPKDIALKYGITAKQVSLKACKEGWNALKTRLAEKVQENLQEKISNLSYKALDALSDVLDDLDAKPADRVAAARAILDVSGLKSLKQEINGIEGVSVIINREAVAVESNN